MTDKTKRDISIVCDVIGFFPSLWMLMMGLYSIGDSGLGGLGVIFILPGALAVGTIAIDFLITIDTIKKGYVYSYMVTITRLGIAALFIPSLIYSIQQEMIGNMSNLGFDLVVILVLVITAIPSIFNIIKLKNKK